QPDLSRSHTLRKCEIRPRTLDQFTRRDTLSGKSSVTETRVMVTGPKTDVLRQVRRFLWLTDGGAGDDQLLEAFLGRGDEAAFAALVGRYGPMVLGVCRRVLRHAQDAEDAFQATFLVLARRAVGIRSRRRLGPWLYGVAYRTALQARKTLAKR